MQNNSIIYIDIPLPLKAVGQNCPPLKCGLHTVVKADNVERGKKEYIFSRET